MGVEYLTDIIVLLLAAVIAVPVFQFLRLGSIPAFVIAGVILGPSGLGYIQNYDEVAHLAELGVVFLLFIIGIEINPTRLWRMKSLVLGMGSLQILLTGVLITLIAHQLLSISWEVALLIGLALSLSSTAFVLQLLQKRKTLYSAYGKPSVAVLLMQDLAVVPLLILVSLIATPELSFAQDIYLALTEAVVILVCIVVIARYVLTPLFNALVRYETPEIFTALTLLLVLGASLAMERIGLSMAMGAFVAGLLIADSSYRHQIVAEIQPFRGLLLALFFMAMGMSLNLDYFLQDPQIFLLLVLGLITVKFLVLWPLSRLFGIKSKAALSSAILLAQSGEFALVLFALAKDLSVLDEVLFQQLLVLVLISMIATPILENIAHRLFSKKSGHEVGLPTIETDLQDSKAIILAGFGRMGHRIGHILESMGVPYVAVDNNTSVVEYERNNAKSVYFGDASRPEVLRAAGAAEAPLIIVSTGGIEATEKIVSSIHSAFPEVPIFARGHDIAKCRELSELGARFTVSETFESSAELAREALLYFGSEDAEIESALEQYRQDYYKPERP